MAAAAARMVGLFGWCAVAPTCFGLGNSARNWLSDFSFSGWPAIYPTLRPLPRCPVTSFDDILLIHSEFIISPPDISDIAQNENGSNGMLNGMR